MPNSKPDKSDRRYLEPHRVRDLLFLINYLGLGRHDTLTTDRESIEKAQSAQLPEGSLANNAWHLVAKDHPEFFRVTKDDSIGLYLRYAIRSKKRRHRFLREHKQQKQEETPSPLSTDTVQSLIKMVFTIHELQLKADAEEHNLKQKCWENRRALLTMIGAAIAGAASLANLVMHWK